MGRRLITLKSERGRAPVSSGLMKSTRSKSSGNALGWAKPGGGASRRKGLRILYVNSRAFICRRDFIEFVERVATLEFRPNEASSAGTDG